MRGGVLMYGSQLMAEMKQKQKKKRQLRFAQTNGRNGA